MLAKAAMPTPVIPASAAPPMATSHRPDATSRAAWPMLWAPAAQAVVTVSEGPCHPMRMETAAAPALDIIIGTRRGETRRGPFSPKTRIWVSRVSRPPTPVPITTPERPGSASISPASSRAMAATATLNWANRSSWRASLAVNQRSGSKSADPALALRGPDR